MADQVIQSLRLVDGKFMRGGGLKNRYKSAIPNK